MKEFNAETCSLEEGIVNCFETELERLGDDDDEQRQVIVDQIQDAANAGHITQEQADALIKPTELEPTTKPPKDPAEVNADRAAWETDLQEKYRELRSARAVVEKLKGELKAARKVLADVQAEVNMIGSGGSCNYRDKKRSLLDYTE